MYPFITLITKRYGMISVLDVFEFGEEMYQSINLIIINEYLPYNTNKWFSQIKLLTEVTATWQMTPTIFTR
jgi:hypothetical protein